MQNPFTMMAAAAAAIARSVHGLHVGSSAKVMPQARRTRDRAPGKPRPAGSKLARMAAEGRCTLRIRRGMVVRGGRVVS